MTSERRQSDTLSGVSAARLSDHGCDPIHANVTSDHHAVS